MKKKHSQKAWNHVADGTPPGQGNIEGIPEKGICAAKHGMNFSREKSVPVVAVQPATLGIREVPALSCFPCVFCKSKPPVQRVVLTEPTRDAARHEGRDNGAVFGNVPGEIARGWDTARTGRSSSARRFQTAGTGSFGRLQPQVWRGRKTAGEDGIRCAGE